jgi:signal transduction histidine kinase
MHSEETSSEDEIRARAARLLSTADAQRREIERNLHDGVQQQLVALAVNLQLARRLVETDLTATIELLDEMRRDVHGALEGARALGQQVYPPLLAARGLGEALRAAASAVAVAARIEAEGVRRYSHDVEANVYFCCLYALVNVAAHAGPDARATVRIEEEGRTLRFEVLDHGTGFDPSVIPPGGGLAHMRDRIEALGGELSIESAASRGARIVATIPLYDSSSAR